MFWIVSLLFIPALFALAFASNRDKPANRLAGESSPYLQQHAHNPVDWYPWSDTAFEVAKQANKPIFLSIGYSTCHWCHVMENESFEDPDVAAMMNDFFINIKVDREERPDIDHLYMTVCQMMTGSGGWPLTIIMSPDKIPFFAGTYIPKSTKYNRMGLMTLLPRILDAWENDREKIRETGSQIIEALKSTMDMSNEIGNGLKMDIAERALASLKQSYDSIHGGFGDAPKFPMGHQIIFLLREYYRKNNPKSLEMALKTLKSMANGGIFDHIGYGFHRYSTDQRWLVPHFEKMLYDQAMLLYAYAEAYDLSGDAFFKKTAQKTITYVRRDMIHPQGGFYSAEDADSEGVEGKFYLWNKNDIVSLLPENEARIIVETFNIRSDGNCNIPYASANSNILHRHHSDDEVAKSLHLNKEEMIFLRENALDILYAARGNRESPLKDDKILTDWNGLMIAGLVRAGNVFNDSAVLKLAKASAAFIHRYLTISDGRLLHRFRGNESGIIGHLTDYSYLIWGLIELYQATQNSQYLKRAIELTDIMIEDFEDPAGGFFFTSNHGEKLLIRQKELYDGALPSGNSVAFYVLNLMAKITRNPDYETRIQRMMVYFSEQINRHPSAFTFFIMSLPYLTGPSFEVIISGSCNEPVTHNILEATQSGYHPNKVVILNDPDNKKLHDLLPYLENQGMLNRRTTAYLCRQFSCHQPVFTASDLKKQLDDV